MFVLASFGFWHWGKSEIARAYVIPTLVAGPLLVIIGFGILFPAQSRVTSFVSEYTADPVGFVAAQTEQADKILGQYRIAVYQVIPLIISLCAVLILCVSRPVWHASLITTIAMMAVILMIDTNANARLEAYKERLLASQRQG